MVAIKKMREAINTFCVITVAFFAKAYGVSYKVNGAKATKKNSPNAKKNKGKTGDFLKSARRKRSRKKKPRISRHDCVKAIKTDKRFPLNSAG